MIVNLAKRIEFLTKAFTRRKTKSSHQRLARQINVETLEDRRVFATLEAFPIGGTPTKAQPAVGGITFNPSTRIVTVLGSDAHNDTVVISLNTRGTPSPADDMVNVQLRNVGNTAAQFSLASVDRIFARVYGGDDTVNNQSPVKLTAYGDAGSDVLLGGSGSDSLIGGTENDFIDGRLGNDTIWGQEGSDALFGDDGSDTILGGAGIDYIFGGNDDDYLYGEADSDRLYGEAGIDRLTDVGSNVLYADYGPVITISASGYLGFDWFDRNLSDADIRSLVRLQYRDSIFQRTDALQVTTQVASDNLVSAKEFADLQKLTTTSINTSADVSFFMNKIVKGDRANQWYKGTTLGNLAAGSSGGHLSSLVNKWMMGGDLPALPTLEGARVDGYAYVSGTLFHDGPRYDEMKQGNVGDCYFLAALGEVALHRRSVIQNMFIDNGDGTFGVRFFHNGVSDFVTVNRYLPVYKSGAVGAGWGGGRFDSQYNELWMALAEKAYAQLNESGWIGQDGTNSYDGISGGNAAPAFTHIAGTPAIEANLSKTGIINAFNAGKAITITTKELGTAENVLNNHVYMLINYDPVSDKFHLFNPWGYGTSYPADLKLSFTEIVANFVKTTSTVV